MDPTDPIVRLSFAGVTNETQVDTAVLLHRGRALAALGVPAGAIDVLTLANQRRKDRPDELMYQIWYDRAVLYEQMGQKADARREMERLYVADLECADVRKRLK